MSPKYKQSHIALYKITVYIIFDSFVILCCILIQISTIRAIIDQYIYVNTIYITRKYVMNQTNTHNNIIIYAYMICYIIARCPGRLSLVVEKYTGHVRIRVQTCPAPWGVSAQEHTFTFCQIFFSFWWKLYSCNMHSIHYYGYSFRM